MMKRLLFLFLLFPVLPLATACGDNGSTDEDPVPSDPREECLFSNLKAVPSSTSVAASAEYSYLGGFLVKENGFTCTADDGTSITVPCERSTTPACTISGLKAETSYELVCYVIAGGHTYLSEPQQFTTLESGEEPEPEEERVVFSALTVSGKTENSATVAASYTYEGPDRVTDAGFLFTGGGQSNVKHSCGTATTLQYTYTDLSANTSYEVKAYAVTPSKTWYGDTAIFTTDAASVAPPASDSKARYKGWAELPDEITHSGWHYIYHMRPDKTSVRNFSLCYSSEYRCTIWAAMAVHDSWDGNAGRNDSWKYDPALSSSLQPNLKKTYSGVFRRGHMVASSDRQVSPETNRQTFYYTNMAPQYQNEFNGGIWNKLENRIWSNYNCSDTLYVVTGAHFANTNKTCKDNDNKTVVVPTHFYKVLLRSKSGHTGKPVWELSADQLQCVGFWLEHNDRYATTATITAQYLVPVSYIEEQTGLRFFPNVPNAPKTTFDKADWDF
ncbi:DNA/RNA non-specific endonuclease [uncultured Alistipes sp.]|uniref:DNA/RNA non-specific endonuclease n=1 Tax=uncultured Alistipes sp. TaxID=538949 RepID=UPI00260AF10F|nr:DNA/RNA non-specific endonuclease [uncultured Alistipes sp.]